METHMMTRFNALEAQVTAALKAAIDKIPCLIAAHVIKPTSSIRRSGPLKRIVRPNIKVDRPQMTLAEKEPTPGTPNVQALMGVGTSDSTILLPSSNQNQSEHHGGQP